MKVYTCTQLPKMFAVSRTLSIESHEKKSQFCCNSLKLVMMSSSLDIEEHKRYRSKTETGGLKCNIADFDRGIEL